VYGEARDERGSREGTQTVRVGGRLRLASPKRPSVPDEAAGSAPGGRCAGQHGLQIRRRADWHDRHRPALLGGATAEILTTRTRLSRPHRSSSFRFGAGIGAGGGHDRLVATLIAAGIVGLVIYASSARNEQQRVVESDGDPDGREVRSSRFDSLAGSTARSPHPDRPHNGQTTRQRADSVTHRRTDSGPANGPDLARGRPADFRCMPRTK